MLLFPLELTNVFFFLSELHMSKYFKYSFPLLISFIPDLGGNYNLAWFH